MIRRNLEIPQASFFLFGPRSTGKTTWLYEKLPHAKWFNLLLDEQFLALSSNPQVFVESVESLDAESWIVIDEIQKMPSLLNAVHYLISKYPGKFNFAISGSSARKLKRLDSNLLAGRVIERGFFPLSANELGGDFNLALALDVGLLPLIYLDKSLARDRLLAYVNTYLKQEIQQEALTNDIPGFSRFLRSASLLNGSIVNYSNVARDAQLKRKIVEKYFAVLVDTLIAFWLPAWQPKATVKELAKPKFYFFDTGVVRACANRIGAPFAPEEQGHLLETYILHEIRSYLNSSNIGGELFYWNSGSGSEVDIIWSRADTHVGIEVKSSKTWKNSFGSGLRTLAERKKIRKAVAIYGGEHSVNTGGIQVLAINDFLLKLYSGEVLSEEES